nr:hypothetical protein [Tanacetum cinerariifolium]
MERGFLDSGDKKKKKDGDGVKKDAIDEAANAANVGIAVKVKCIDGKLRKPIRGAPITMDVPAMGSIKGRDSHLEKVHTYVGGPPTKSILKKTDYEKEEARNGGKNTPTKVRFRPISTSTVAIPADAEGSSNGGTCEARIDCSFASLVRPKESSTKVHFCALVNDEKLESFDCVLPKAAASKLKSRYENSIVGFFLGKDPSFPVVKQYALNTWRKFGFEKITRNDNGVYLFKFASKSGVDQVLEKGPWLIRKSPIILNKWTPSVSLKKGEVANVPVWVKMYNVPVLAYSEDGLSLIATQIGKPIMLDAFTSSMCVESWGRISFARALIEVIRIEYEWKPPHCVDCLSFGHDSKLCPKRVREEVPNNSARDTKATTMEENDDGFTEVKSRKKKKGVDFGGIRLNKPKSKVMWLGASKPSSSKSVYCDGHKDKNKSSHSKMKKWDVINEDDTTDDEDVFNSYGDSFGGGNQLEDEDFDFYEGYADQVVDLDGALKDFRDFKEQFCLVIGLKFGVENWTDYDDEKEPIPFRHRVFCSSLDGRPIRGKNVETLINSEAFKTLDDNDAVSLCCVGILQLVLSGLKDRRPTLAGLICPQPKDEVDKKSYSITGFAWAFKTWILESFRAAMNDYYTCYRRLPRIVAWSSKNKFYRNMLKPFLQGQLPVQRLVPDENEARSRTLDGLMRPYPSWKDVNWVYMEINVGGVHWVTGAINLTDSIFYVFDSIESESRMLMLEQQVRDWTPVINRILQIRRYFNGTRRQPHNLQFSYNDCFGYAVPQQQNAKDCGIITSCLVPHTYDEIKSMVEKQIQEDRGRQLAIMNLGHQYGDVIKAKDELLKAYEQCRDISMDKRAMIEK